MGQPHTLAGKVSREQLLGVGRIQSRDIHMKFGAVRALRTANIELIPAPGAGLAVIPLMIHLFLENATDYVQTNNSDQLAILYNSGSEIAEIGSEAQCTTFAEASADAALFDPLNASGVVPEANKAVDLDNNGAASWTTGQGSMSVRIWYVVVPFANFT